MGSIAHPEDSDAWDQVTLGPVKLPGIWTVEGEATLELEVKKTRGKDGARFRDNGYDPAELTLVGRMIERSDWNTMQSALKQIHPRLGKPRNPLTLEHPAAAYLGVTTVYVKSVSTPRMEGGILTLEIDVLEWVEAPKVAKPSRRPVSSDGGLARINMPDGSVVFDASPHGPDFALANSLTDRAMLGIGGGPTTTRDLAFRQARSPSMETPQYILGKP
jgi:hypothetical protein